MILKSRKAWSIMALTLAVLLAVISCGRGKSFVVAKKGKSAYAIVLSSDSSLSEQYAAIELQHFVNMATGAELPIVGDNTNRAKMDGRIFIGAGKAVDEVIEGGEAIDMDALGDEGFVLRSVAGVGKYPDILIVGGRRRGTMYGVYTFLEKLGFRWYTNRVTRYTSGKVLKTEPFDIRLIPRFMSRDTSIREARDADWAARNRMNSGHSQLDEKHGGKVGVLGVHTLDRLIPPSLFKEHPEYFPLIGGKRVTGLVQRCMSNPDLVDIAVENLVEWMDSEPGQRIFSVSANDVGMLCGCPECRKITEEEGATSGLFLRFVNQVAERIEETHQQNYISTLAYAVTEKAPEITKPRHNVIIRLCPFFICCSHPYSECTSKASSRFYQTLQDWGKISENIFIWHYAVNFDAYLLPFPNFNEFTKDLKTYSKHNVNGLFLQGAGKSGSCDGDMRAWVAAQLMWNSELDPDDLINEWMHAIYADAYEPMREIFEHIHSRVADPENHLGIHDRIRKEDWPDEELSHVDSLYETAETLAEGNEDALYYVRKNRMSVKYLQMLFNSGQLAVEGDVYRPSGSSVTGEDYRRFRSEMDELDISGLREEPFDCVYEDLLGKKLEEYKIVYLENEDMKIAVVPSLGGRIVSIVLKETSKEVVGMTDPLNYFYPSYGGYEESTTMTWGRTGFDNVYTAELNGRTLTLTSEEGKSRRSRMFVFERTLSLPERGTRIDFESSILNVSGETRYARLISHMEINADPKVSEVGIRTRSGKIITEDAKNFYKNGQQKPAGLWYVKNIAGGWNIENRFKASEVEGCRLFCYSHTGTIEMEVLGFERNIEPGGRITRKHTWELK